MADEEMTIQEEVELLRSKGWRARVDGEQIRIQCVKGVVAVRVNTEDPEVLEVVSQHFPCDIMFSREGAPGFTTIFQGKKIKSRELTLANGGKIEILANGEWIVVPRSRQVKQSDQ